MAIKKDFKKEVWKHLFRLILPHRKKFLWVVTLGLLSTGASLVEPLIYREAINDVAGLFVRQARENARQDLGLSQEEEESIRSTLRSELPDSAGVKDSARLPATHSHGRVAPRSPSQALRTLLWAV